VRRDVSHHCANDNARAPSFSLPSAAEEEAAATEEKNDKDDDQERVRGHRLRTSNSCACAATSSSPSTSGLGRADSTGDARMGPVGAAQLQRSPSAGIRIERERGHGCHHRDRRVQSGGDDHPALRQHRQTRAANDSWWRPRSAVVLHVLAEQPRPTAPQARERRIHLFGLAEPEARVEHRLHAGLSPWHSARAKVQRIPDEARGVIPDRSPEDVGERLRRGAKVAGLRAGQRVGLALVLSAGLAKIVAATSATSRTSTKATRPRPAGT